MQGTTVPTNVDNVNELIEDADFCEEWELHEWQVNRARLEIKRDYHVRQMVKVGQMYAGFAGINVEWRYAIVIDNDDNDINLVKSIFFSGLLYVSK